MAPADEYFGQARMSVLAIRNEIAILDRRAAEDPGARAAIVPRAAMVEAAMRDWAAQFPRDPWLPRFRLSLARVYGRLAAGRRSQLGPVLDVLTRLPRR